MNVDKIFNEFLPLKDEEDSNGVLLNFNENPLVWVTFFKKIILNHNIFKQQVVEEFIHTGINNLTEEDLIKAGNYIIYGRAYFFISKINIDMPSHSDAIYSISDDKLIKAFKLIIRYFESTEEYERCSFLINILDKIKVHEEKFGNLKKRM